MGKLRREERLEYLRETIERARVLSIGDLLDGLDVSRMTLFRDLKLLEKEGFIERLYGGVALSRTFYNIDESMLTNIDEKVCIAQRASSLVGEGDSVFFEAGSTVYEVAKAVVNRGIKITAVTNSLPVACLLRDSNNVRLVMIGGEYHTDTQSYVGSITQKALEGLSGQILFFGASGIDIKGGITGYYSHAALIRDMMEICRTNVAVADSTKFGKIYTHRICNVNQVDMIITDDNIDPFDREEIAALGVQLLICHEST